eukprot:5407808-Pyramimonas_sp.AAC.1
MQRGLNGNAWTSIVDHIDEAPLGRNTILFIQEHKLSRDYVGEASAACLNRHLTAEPTDSATGPGCGRTAG